MNEPGDYRRKEPRGLGITETFSSPAIKGKVSKVGKVRKSFFIPTTQVEAYRKWKSFWGLTTPSIAGESKLLQETPNGSLHWSSRWGFTRIEGEAEFIPAQGGCVLYLGLGGASALSRLLLASPLSNQLWRSVERFRLPAGDAWS